MSDTELLPISGIILAGGASRRMGTDKAWISVGGKAIIERQIEALNTICKEVIVVTNDLPRFAELGVRTTTDKYLGKGSLGGIYSGLLFARYDRSIVVACDLPFLSPGLLRHLASLCPECDVVIPSTFEGKKPKDARQTRVTAKDEELHPLHAVYSNRCLAPIEARLNAGDLRMISFHDAVRVCAVPRSELSIYDPQLLSLFNVNTPEDLSLAKQFLIASAARDERMGA